VLRFISSVTYSLQADSSRSNVATRCKYWTLRGPEGRGNLPVTVGSPRLRSRASASVSNRLPLVIPPWLAEPGTEYVTVFVRTCTKVTASHIQQRSDSRLATFAMYAIVLMRLSTTLSGSPVRRCSRHSPLNCARPFSPVPSPAKLNGKRSK
jgi:hypothetical protein